MERAAPTYRRQRGLDTGAKRVVGVNYQAGDADDEELRVFRPDPATERNQVDRLQELRRTRVNDLVDRNLARLEEDAQRGRSVVPGTIAAIDSYATVGEVTAVLDNVFGRYAPNPSW